MKQQRSAINTLLWVLQILWGIFFSFTGFGKILCINDAVWHHLLPNVAWFSAVPQPLFVFIGIAEFLGGVGLILPAMTGVKPKLTAYAALGLTLVMILAALFHIARGEAHFFVPTNLVIGAGTAIIAYGRLYLRPHQPTQMSAFRAIEGVAVLCALAFSGFAPVWYQMTHIH